MTKVKKVICSFVLFICVGAFSINTAHASMVLSIAQQVFSALSVLNDYYATAQQKEQAQRLLILQFPRTSDISSSYAVRVSSDDLYRTCMDLVQSGMHCEVRTVTIAGLSNVKVIYVLSEPRDPYSGSLMAPGWTFTGKYFAPTTAYSSDHPHLLYAVGDNSAYSLDLIRGYVSSIATTVNTISTNVSAISNKITNNIVPYIDGIEGYLGQVVTYFTNQATTLNNIYGRLSYTDSSGVTGSVASYLYNIQNRLVFTTGNLTYSAGDLLYNIWQRLTFTIDGTTHSAASLLYNIWQKSNDLYGAVDGVETTLNVLSSDVSTMKSDLHSLVTNVYVTLYTGDSSGTAYSTIAYRPDVINDYIAYLNQNFQNKQVNVLYRDQDGVATGTVRTFMYADVYNGYVRMRLKLPSGGVAYGYLATPNKVLIKEAQTYVDDLTFYQKLTSIETAINSISTDNSSVVAAIDRIYEWLDNADLATNATIVQVVQDYSHDVNHSVDWASRILDLFKRVYIFDRPAPSFSGILDYFSSLGSD